MNVRFFAGLCCIIVVAMFILAANYDIGPVDAVSDSDPFAFASGEGEQTEILIDSPPALLDLVLASHVLLPPDELQAPEFVGLRGPIENGWNPREPDHAQPFAFDAPDVPVIAAVTYDGQPFDHWRSLLLNELKPEKRLEAVQAVHRFGMNGHSGEAAEAMLTVLDGYSARIWIELASDSLELAVAVAMEQHELDLNADSVLIANAIFALFEMAPSVIEHLESHARQEWTGLGPLVSLQLLADAAPQRAVPILFDLIRKDENGLKSEVAFQRLKAIRHNPAVVTSMIEFVAERPDWRHSMLELLEHVEFTPDVVRFLLATIQSGGNSQSLATALCTSGLLQALANGDDLETPNVSADDFQCPELQPLLHTILGSHELRVRYRKPAIELIVRTDPEAIMTLKTLIERLQSHDPVCDAAQDALDKIESEAADADAPTATQPAD